MYCSLPASDAVHGAHASELNDDPRGRLRGGRGRGTSHDTRTRGISPANVQNHLKGVHYPARKDDLIATAKRNGAPKEILDIVKGLPEEEFGGLQDVMKAYGELDLEEEVGARKKAS